MIQFLQDFLLIGAGQATQHAPDADVNGKQYDQDDDCTPKYAAEPVKD